MYSYEYDVTTGGILLNSTPLMMSKEPRPVYYKELDILGFDKYWKYAKDDTYPYMWAEANNYFYRGRNVAKIKGGSCFTAPKIIILEDPEPNGEPLKFVNVNAMVEKNRFILESLVQETIKNTYNTYTKYKNKVDIFHVSYSGGKDSEVTLDIVQRALPHNDFIVIFGDTKMEFPDTYDAVEKTKKFCKENDIQFYTTSTEFDPHDSWKVFGTPSSAMRWCCGVHKTAPQLLKIREILHKSDVKEMAFVGIRSSESLRRSGYDYVSVGTKHSEQSSCNPIIEWNTAEVYLYIYTQNLYINEAYKKGSSRAGCLLCPMASLKSDYLNYTLYPNEIQPYIDIIKELYIENKTNPLLVNSYIENKGWKARKNGRDLTIAINDFDEETKQNKRIITFYPKNNSWLEWIKTIGYLEINNKNAVLRLMNGTTISFVIHEYENGSLSLIFNEEDAKYKVAVFKNIKNILKKSHSCVGCRYCEANCPYGNITFKNGIVKISDSCIKCGFCNKIENGCLVYNSLVLPKGNGKMRKGSIDEYGTHSPKMEWLVDFVKIKEIFNFKNCNYNKPMYSMFNRFLRDAGVISSNSFEPIANIMFERGLQDEIVWGLMFVNLAYAPQVGWLVDNLNFGIKYTQIEIKDMLSSFITTKTGPGNVSKSYGNMAELPLSKVGFGMVLSETRSGFELIRTPWQNPDSRVILYALYKFAEGCGEYYQFTLNRLLNYSIDSDGISPTRIFGIEREQMEQILNGLSINYPEFINASFTHDLNNITLRSEKTSRDVLSLFKKEG